MDIKIYPGKLKGNVTAIPSKSQAHRLLICAAFSDGITELLCHETNLDIEATVRCLNAIGAEIIRTENGYRITPVKSIPKVTVMDCGESGSTLRFILPVVCALGIDTTIHMSGRLPYRPMSPLWEELERMGCCLSRPTDTTIRAVGKLRAGRYTVAGNVSSQFVTGLLFALALIDGESNIQITGNLESEPYVEMTRKALAHFGVIVEDYHISGCFPFHTPGKLLVEGDWSNAAFFLTATALGSDVTVSNLNVTSPQGDRIIADILSAGESRPVISAANIPDLVPILSVYFAAGNGAVFTDIARLRLKESDRVGSVCQMLASLGIKAEFDSNILTVYSGKLTGGTVNTYADHRIAMAAAIAATVAEGAVIIHGAECVAKSYPAFWREYKALGGNYEQYIR